MKGYRAASYAIMILVALCVAAICAGPALAAGRAGTVWAWGRNSDGQLGDGTTTGKTPPMQVQGFGGSGYLTGVIAVAGGGTHTDALKSDGTVWAWGGNAYGQLGYGELDNGMTLDSSTACQVKGPNGTGVLTKVTRVAAGWSYTLAITPPAGHDFNNDGKVDILWRNVATGWNVVWYMDGVTPISDDGVPSVDDRTWWIVGK
jgi:alpha-tubulin suppressor-like RCC1 family protein